MKAKSTLRELMKKQGREANWFADLLGVSKSHISNITNGKRDIDPIRASMIAGALGVPLLFVFEDTDVSILDTVETKSGKTA